MKKIFTTALILTVGLFIASCGGESEKSTNTGEAPVSMVEDEPEAMDPMENKGVGPISSVSLGAEVDAAMAAKGQEIFDANCTACHKIDKKFVGPSPTGVLDRRSPEWVMNMIMNPENMLLNDPIAKDLLAEYNNAPMANQNIAEDGARAILEYFRTLK
jgi:cytochrome c